MIALHTERLEIRIQNPGAGYRRSRFDWSGICEQITLDGVHTFCSQEATEDEPGTEGVGVIDEFGIATPIGYDEAQVGDWFPKIGIGFLQKITADPYDFMADYPMRGMPIQVDQTEDAEVRFEQNSEVVNGWGWRLQKIYSLDGPNLSIDYSLENTGEKVITTEQYNHNFLAIDGETIGPAYQMKTSFPLQCEVADGGIQIEGPMFGLTEVPPTYIYALQTECANLQNEEWALVQASSGHGVRVREQFPLFKFALWAKSHVISPEFFVWINLQPGENQTWRREYHFF